MHTSLVGSTVEMQTSSVGYNAISTGSKIITVSFYKH